MGVTSFSPGTLSIHPTDVTIGFGGPQEGSAARYSGSLAWQGGLVCGDGAATVFDPQNPNTVYATCEPDQFGIYKSTSGGTTSSAWVQAQKGVDLSDRSAVYRPLAIDSTNPQRLYYATFRVYQTTDGAGSWKAISPDISGFGSSVSTIAVAPSDPNTVYVGTTSQTNGVLPAGPPPTRFSVTNNALAGESAVWVSRSVGLPTRWAGDISVDSADSRIAFVTFRGFSGFPGDTPGHVFKTSNGGLNWSDISGNLPNAPANAIAIDPDLANTLYVGTDAGVFFSKDGGGSWSPLMDGLPRVMVMALKLHRNSRTLRAATLGRGMWDLQIPR